MSIRVISIFGSHTLFWGCEVLFPLSPKPRPHLCVEEVCFLFCNIHNPAVTLPSTSTCTSVSYRVLLPQVRCVRLLQMLGNKMEQRCFTPGAHITGTLGSGQLQPTLLSRLGNPTDSGAWWATVHRVARVRNDFETKSPPLVGTV